MLTPEEIEDLVNLVTAYYSTPTPSEKLPDYPEFIKYVDSIFSDLNFSNFEVEDKLSQKEMFASSPSEPRYSWFSIEMYQNDIEAAELEFRKMKQILTVSLLEAWRNNPELGIDKMGLNEIELILQDLVIKKGFISARQLKRKAIKSRHLKEWIPEEIYPGVPTDLSKIDFNNAEAYAIVTLATYQIKTFMKNDDVTPRLAWTITDAGYRSLITFYHKPSGLVLFYGLPGLNFVTFFPLDKYQQIVYDQARFIPLRQTKLREFDQSLKTLQNLPVSFTEMAKTQSELLKMLRELKDKYDNEKK